MSIGGVQLNSSTSRPRRSITGGVLLFGAAVLLVLSFLRLHYISGHASAELLWNKNEAYVFVHGERLGDTPSYLGYLLALIKGYFFVISPPDERQPFTTVIHISASGAERYDQNKEFDYFTPVDNHVYASRMVYSAQSNDPRLWKWVENHFEEMSAMETVQLRGSDGFQKIDFKNRGGWSGVYTVQSRKEQSFQIGDLTVTLRAKDRQLFVMCSRPGTPAGNQTIAVRLYYGDSYPERVSRAEYERVFGN
jgi:hypothetical protein